MNHTLTDEAKAPANRLAEVRHGWMALLAAFIGNALGAGVLIFYSLGVLGPELHRQFGWGRGEIGGGLLAMTLATLIASPIVGVATDRWGVRRVVVISTLLLSCALALLAIVPLSLATWYGLLVLVAVAGAGTFPMTWTRLINQQFQASRGFALGISFIGTGLTGFLLKPVLFKVLTAYGLGGAYLMLAILPLVVTVTTLLLVRHERTDRAAVDVASQPVALGQTFREALVDWRFWVLMVVVGAAAIGVGGPLPNMESALQAKGLTPADAVAAAQIIGIAIVVGRIGGGALLDRVWAPLVGAVGLVLGGIGCMLIMGGPSHGGAIRFEVFLIGVASGLETDLVAFLVVRYFGMRSYSTIYGMLYGIFALGTGIGATAFGAIADSTRSFATPMTLFGIVLFASAAVMLSLGRYRFVNHPGQGTTAVAQPQTTG